MQMAKGKRETRCRSHAVSDSCTHALGLLVRLPLELELAQRAESLELSQLSSSRIPRRRAASSGAGPRALNSGAPRPPRAWRPALDLVWDSLSLPLYNQQLNCVAECSRVTANCLSREAP
jgi:hypothetical protein